VEQRFSAALTGPSPASKAPNSTLIKSISKNSPARNQAYRDHERRVLEEQACKVELGR
jgi:hypothetical protein